MPRPYQHLQSSRMLACRPALKIATLGAGRQGPCDAAIVAKSGWSTREAVSMRHPPVEVPTVERRNYGEACPVDPVWESGIGHDADRDLNGEGGRGEVRIA